jgi:type VI secretion system protein ImpA
VRGSIRSREDVVRVIDNICNYYEQVEPCSPVPYLLRRAQKLARMNFIEAVQELNLATTDSLRPSMGSAVPADAPPAA